MKFVIVSRHPAAVEFVRAHGGPWADAPVLASATTADVRGAVVAGNLPLHLASLAAGVFAIEFDGAAPRGGEYSLDEMRAAGARLSYYRVVRGLGDDIIAQSCSYSGAPVVAGARFGGFRVIERLKYPPSDCDGGRMGRELVPVEVESEIERWRGTADADDLDSALVEVYALPHAGAPGRRFDGATWSWVAP